MEKKFIHLVFLMFIIVLFIGASFQDDELLLKCEGGECSFGEEITEEPQEDTTIEETSNEPETSETSESNSTPSENNDGVNPIPFNSVNEWEYLGVDTLMELSRVQMPAYFPDFYGESEEEVLKYWSSESLMKREEIEAVELVKLPSKWKNFFNHNSPYVPLFPGLSYREEIQMKKFADTMKTLYEAPENENYFFRASLVPLFTETETESIRIQEENSVPYHMLIGLSQGTRVNGYYDYVDEFIVCLEGRMRILLASPKDLNENMYLFPWLHPFRVHVQFNIDYFLYKDFPKTVNITWYEVILNAGDALNVPSLWFHEIQALDKATHGMIYRRTSIVSTLSQKLYKKVFPYPGERSPAFQILLARTYLKLLVDSVLGPGSLQSLVVDNVLDRYASLFDLSENPDSFASAWKNFFATCDDSLQDVLDKFEWIQETYHLEKITLDEMKNNIQDIVEFYASWTPNYKDQIRFIFKNFIEDYLGNEGNAENVPAYLNFCFYDVPGPFVVNYDSEGRQIYQISTSKEGATKTEEAEQ